MSRLFSAFGLFLAMAGGVLPAFSPTVLVVSLREWRARRAESESR